MENDWINEYGEDVRKLSLGDRFERTCRKKTVEELEAMRKYYVKLARHGHLVFAKKRETVKAEMAKRAQAKSQLIN